MTQETKHLLEESLGELQFQAVRRLLAYHCADPEQVAVAYDDQAGIYAIVPIDVEVAPDDLTKYPHLCIDQVVLELLANSSAAAISSGAW